MLQKLAKAIVSWLISNNVIELEERELYEYAAFNCIFVLLPFFLIIPFCIVSGKLINGALFTIAFMMIRKTGGGYHAKTPMRCWAYSCTIVIFLIYISSLIKNNISLQYIFYLMQVIVWFICPVDVETHKLDMEEKERYRKSCRIFEIFILSGFVVLNSIGLNELAASLALGFCFAASLQIIGLLK